MPASAATQAKSDAAKAAMEAKIQAAAQTLTVAAPSLAKSKGKTYETWVMFEVAARLSATHPIEPRDSAGQPTPDFRVRGGPGHIRGSAENPAKLPCHFELTPTSQPWRPPLELHNSVEHVGLSDETHELDISVMPKRDVDVTRGQPHGGPFHGRLVLGAELKAFDEHSTLDKAIARALVGAIVDLHPGAVLKSVQVELRNSPYPYTAHIFPQPHVSLMTTAHITDETTKYLRGFGVNAWAQVGPGGNDAPLDELAEDLKAWL